MLTHWAFSNGWEPSPISANSQVPQTFSLSGIGVLHCFEDVFVKCGDFRAGFTSRLKLLDPEPGVVGMREGNTVSDVARGHKVYRKYEVPLSPVLRAYRNGSRR